MCLLLAHTNVSLTICACLSLSVPPLIALVSTDKFIMPPKRKSSKKRASATKKSRVEQDVVEESQPTEIIDSEVVQPQFSPPPEPTLASPGSTLEELPPRQNEEPVTNGNARLDDGNEQLHSTTLFFLTRFYHSIETQGDEPVVDLIDNVALLAVMPGLEDDVINPDNPEDMPIWLQLDQLAGKYVFAIDAFPFEDIPARLELTKKAKVKPFNWMQFNVASTTMVKDFYDQYISKYYLSGISQLWRRNFCAALASKLPRMAKKYRQIRNQSASGGLSPDLSKTVKSYFTYSVRDWSAMF